MEVESNVLIWKGVIQLVTCAAHADALNMGSQVKGGKGRKRVSENDWLDWSYLRFLQPQY
jgi:hypothetical protein